MQSPHNLGCCRPPQHSSNPVRPHPPPPIHRRRLAPRLVRPPPPHPPAAPPAPPPPQAPGHPYPLPPDEPPVPPSPPAPPTCAALARDPTKFGHSSLSSLGAMRWTLRVDRPPLSPSPAQHSRSTGPRFRRREPPPLPRRGVAPDAAGRPARIPPARPCAPLRPLSPLVPRPPPSRINPPLIPPPQSPRFPPPTQHTQVGPAPAGATQSGTKLRPTMLGA